MRLKIKDALAHTADEKYIARVISTALLFLLQMSYNFLIKRDVERFKTCWKMLFLRDSISQVVKTQEKITNKRPENM